eukprot:Macronucleus_2645.p1 GENE.Macronucleus_2645~~Macronucleus_2645.p1  ORF type:complete len:237 (+),score=22.63 Macronucleus_2645:1-711(+)
MKSVFASALLAASSSAYTGVDVSTLVSESTWECLMSPGGEGAVEWVSVRALITNGQTDSNAPDTIKNARTAGIKHVSAYILPCVSCGDGAKQVNDTVYLLNSNNAEPDMYWYDVAASDWSTDLKSNQDFIKDMVIKGQSLGITAGVYTSRSNWDKVVGLDWTYPSEQGLPLWYAHNDDTASFSDFEAFGGWTKPIVKQFEKNQQSCGAGLDYDYMSSLSGLELDHITDEFEPFLQY